MERGSLIRGCLLLMRLLQWASAVIIVGIVSYLINEGPKGAHLIYEEVIVSFCSRLVQHSLVPGNYPLGPAHSLKLSRKVN